MNSNVNKIICILFILFFAVTAFAILQSQSTNIFAVTENEKGMIAKLKLFTVPGDGSVAFITSNSLVGKDTQITGNTALTIAQKKTNANISMYDFIFDIKANAYEVDGPSAGAAMTLLAYALLLERNLSQDIGVTGTINSDGSIGVVGGVYPKAKVAYENGLKLFMIPKGEANQIIRDEGRVKSVNLLEYGPKEWGMKIVEVTHIDEVIEYAYMNISDIEVETAAGPSFIPEAISYDEKLSPMKKFSEGYIQRANIAISRAKKELETTTLSEDKRSQFYPQLGIAERNVEMSQIYADQNYLYSAANYAFNAAVLANTISQIAEKPSLLNGNAKLLYSEITFIQRDIDLLKNKFTFIPLDKYEWFIGAQQRIGYAENAINSIVFDENSSESKNFEYVYSVMSAKGWLEIAEDFYKESLNAINKKEVFYSEEFIKIVKNKIIEIDDLLLDVNSVSESTYIESLRRLNSAKVSLSNKFYFAALYDAFFAEAFYNSDLEKSKIDMNNLEQATIDLVKDNKNVKSIWGQLYLDHASFFIKQAEYKSALGYVDLKIIDLKTSYDLAYLTNRIEVAKDIVDEYLTFTDLNTYYSNEPIVSVEYIPNGFLSGNRIYYFGSLLILLVLLLGLLVLMGWNVRRKNDFWDPSRAEKVSVALTRLDKALHQKKISDAEYFFLKKQYEGEFSSLRANQLKRSHITLSLDEARAKLRALQIGLSDFRKHYKAGLILSEDYEDHLKKVNKEINELKKYIKKQHHLIRTSSKKIEDAERDLKTNFKDLSYKKEINFDSKKETKSEKENRNKKEEKLKGTELLGKEEQQRETTEKKQRREKIKKFISSRNKNKK